MMTTMGALSEVERRVLGLWHDPGAAPLILVEVVAKRTGLPLHVAAAILAGLQRRGLVQQQERRGQGWIDIGWVLTDAGHQHRGSRDAPRYDPV